MFDTLNSQFFSNKYADEQVNTHKQFFVGQPAQNPKVNSDGNGQKHDVGAYLASGVTTVEEAKFANNNNFFVNGSMSGASEITAENVEAQTRRISSFKTAYSNFMSFPNKQSAQALKSAYFGENGDDPIQNKSVKQLYEMKKTKIEELINSK